MKVVSTAAAQTSWVPACAGTNGKGTLLAAADAPALTHVNAPAALCGFHNPPA